MTAPALEKTAYLTAKAVNESGAPLLAGPIELFVEGEFVGRSRIEAVPEGDEIELAFGPDERIRIEREVLERKRTVHFHCHRADDLLTAVRLAREFDFEIVLQHATEGYRIADQLAAGKIPVSLTLVDSPGGKLEAMGVLDENAAILTKAGVKVALNTDDFITESRFFLRAGAIAVRGGLSEDQGS